MEALLTITWDAAKGIDLGFITLRYYSLLFASGFIMGYFIMKGIFKREGVPLDKLDTLVTYVVISTILGARLGHVFFYQWDYYSQHPVEILKIWEGGLASHGAAIAIIIAIIIYCRKELKKPVLWMLDRLVITVALAGCMIRLGNFMNSEIYGEMANSNWQTVYVTPVEDRLMSYYGDYLRSVEFAETGAEEITDSLDYPVYKLTFNFQEQIAQKAVAEALVFNRIAPMLRSLPKEDQNFFIAADELKWEPAQNTAVVTGIGVPRRPTQLYEAFGYLMIFFILFRVYQNASLAQRQGLIFGLFLILVFGFRFFIEFYKENQVSAEEGRDLNIGQMLSIPLVLAGLFFAIRAKKPNA